MIINTQTNTNKITVEWTTDHVRIALVGDPYYATKREWDECITEEQALKVLLIAKDEHNKGNFINYELLHNIASKVLKTKLYLVNS